MQKVTLAVPALLLLLLSAPAAAQQDEAACQASYVAGQKAYKLEHDLLRGREQLLVCARACPDQLRASCGKWLREIESELPSIVLKAKDARGRDVSDVAVDVDDAQVAAYAEGLPIELNPGKHTVRVRDRAGRTLVQPVLVSAGEKLKVVEIWLEPRAADAPRVLRPVPTPMFVLLGVGAAALASWGTFAIWSAVEFSKTSHCSPTCNPADRDTGFGVKTAMADVSLAVAGAALVGAAIVYATRPEVVERPRPTAEIQPAIGAGFAGASFAGRF
jgi:hypothetical protein